MLINKTLPTHSGEEPEKKYIDSHFAAVDPNIPFKNEDSMMKVASIISELMIESSKDTLSLIAHDELQKASDILMKSQHIYVFGFGAYVPLAKIFQLKMSRIKKHVIVQDFIGEENYQVDMVSNNDCAIVVSYSGENETLIDVTRQLKENDISLIALTSIGENTLSNLCSCILNISTREKIFSKIANYSSEYSVKLIFDILYSLCFKDDYSYNLDYKIKHSKKVESTHFSTNIIINLNDHMAQVENFCSDMSKFGRSKIQLISTFQIKYLLFANRNERFLCFMVIQNN